MKRDIIKSLLKIITLFTSAYSIQLYAADSCSTISSPKDLLACAVENHPDLIRGKESIKQADEFGAKAGQRPNPELDMRGIYGKGQNTTINQNELNLSHTFELGGKRDARIQKAKAEQSLVLAEFLKIKENVYIATLMALYRIRHIHTELASINEAIETFTTIKNQYHSRPKMSPEQEVSYNVFNLAEGDYKLQKSRLEAEEYALERSIELAIGNNFPHTEAILPKKKQSWSKYVISDDFKGSQFRLSQSELSDAQAEIGLTRSDAWSNLKVGPTIQSQTEGSTTIWSFGLNLSAPLPLLQANEGARSVAQAGLLRAEKSLELRKRELTQEQNKFLVQYEKTTQSLQESAKLPELEKKHMAIDRQFERGMIPSSLVIEAHRQMIDFTKTQNEQELQAIEAWLKLRTIDGTLFEGET